jgi:hypothetical protein
MITMDDVVEIKLVDDVLYLACDVADVTQAALHDL